jgi:hypothetical protein
LKVLSRSGVVAFQARFRAALLKDYVDQNHAENEGRRSANYLDLSISTEPPIDHSSMSIQAQQWHRDRDD